LIAVHNKLSSAKHKTIIDSETRSRLLDAAATIMVEESYASVSAKRMATLANVSLQRVRDYFGTMDDVFIALLRRDAEFTKHRLDHAFASKEPFRELWKVYSDAEFSRLTSGYLALTHHREEIRLEAKGLAKNMRRLETGGLSRVLKAQGVDAEALPAAGLAIMLAAVPSAIALERGMGFADGHREAIVAVNTLLSLLEQWKDIAPLRKLKRNKVDAKAPKKRTSSTKKTSSSRTR
jgi:AcrR family transcriptional regulator